MCVVGEIFFVDIFFIDYKIQFWGDIFLDVEKEVLCFDGYVCLNVEKFFNKYWFMVSFEGDKNDLVINYDVLKFYDDELLFFGIFLLKEFVKVYLCLLMLLLFCKDCCLLDVFKGVVKYLEDKDQFIYGDFIVVLVDVFVGNKIFFKNMDGSVEVEGKFIFGDGLKYVSVDVVGCF